MSFGKSLDGAIDLQVDNLEVYETSDLQGDTRTESQIVLYNSLNDFSLSASQIIQNYSLNLPPSTGAAGQVLATDGIGNLSWYSIPTTAGNVSFVGLSVPTPFTVNGASNASITTTGTFMIEFTSTGTGDVVLATSPTLITPIIGDATGTTLQLSSLTASSLLQTDASKNLVSLSNGVDGEILTMASGAPAWQVPATSGTVTSVTLTVPSILSVSGSPITTSGTFDITTTDTPTGTGSIVLATSPTLSDPTSNTITLSGLTASSAVATDADKKLVSVTNTGTGSNVLATSPTLSDPTSNTITLSNLTAYRVVLTDASKNLVSLSAGTTGQVLTSQGSSEPIWTTPTTTGGVTSVAMTVPSFMAISGSPITTSGTLALTASSTGTGSVVLASSPTITLPTITSINTSSTNPFVIKGLPQPTAVAQITPSFADVQIKTTSIIGLDNRDFQILQKGNLNISTGNAKVAVDVYNTTDIPNRVSSFPFNEVTPVGAQTISPSNILDDGSGGIKIRIQNAPTYFTLFPPQIIVLDGGGYSGIYSITNADANFIYINVPYGAGPTGDVTIAASTTYNGDLALSGAVNASITGNKKLTLNTRDTDGEMYLSSNYMVIRTQGGSNRLRFDTGQFDAYASGYKFFTPAVTDPTAGGIDSFVAGTIAWNAASDFEASTGGAADLKAFANAKIWGGGYIDIIVKPYNLPLISYVLSGISPPATSGDVTIKSEHRTYFATCVPPVFPPGVFPSSEGIMLTPVPIPIPTGAIVTKEQKGDVQITSNTGGGVFIQGQRQGVTIKSKREYLFYSGPKIAFLPTVYVGVPPALNAGILLDSTEGGAGPVIIRAGNISETEGGLRIVGSTTIASESTSIDGIGISMYGTSLAIANQTITWTGSSTISTFATMAIQRTTLTRSISGTTDVNIAAGLIVEDPNDGGNLIFTNKYAIYAIGSIYSSSFLASSMKIEDSSITVGENLEVFAEDFPLANTPQLTVMVPSAYFGTGTNAIVNVGLGVVSFPIGSRVLVQSSSGNISGSYNGTYTVTGGTLAAIGFTSAAIGNCTSFGTVSLLPPTTIERWKFEVTLGTTLFPIGTTLYITDYSTLTGSLNVTTQVTAGDSSSVEIDNNANWLIGTGNIRAFIQTPTATTGNGLFVTITVAGGTNTYKSGSLVEVNYPSTPTFNGIYTVSGSSSTQILVSSTLTSFNLTDAQVNSVVTLPLTTVSRSNILFTFSGFNCSRAYIVGNRVNLQGFTGVGSSINGVWSIKSTTSSTLTVVRSGDTQGLSSVGTVQNDFNTVQYFTGAVKSSISIGDTKLRGFSIGVDSQNSILSIKSNPTTPLFPSSVDIYNALTLSTSTTTGTLVVSGGLGVSGAINSQSLNLSSLSASSAVATDSSKNLVSVTNTGTGNNVLASSPTIDAINLTGNGIVSGSLSITSSGTTPLVLESTNTSNPLLQFLAPNLTAPTSVEFTLGRSIFAGNCGRVVYNYDGVGAGTNSLIIGIGSNIYSSGLEFFNNNNVRFNGLTAARVVVTDASKNLVSLSAGTTGQVLTSQGSSGPIWTTPTTGGVTSVAMTVPSFMSITGSPITTSGTLALTATTTGTGNVVLATSPTLVTPTLGVASATSLVTTSFIASQTSAVNANGGITSRNLSNATSAFSFIELRNDSANSCIWYMNSSTKTSDGDVNSSTIRNDAGTLRLQSSSAVGLEFTGTTATFTSSTVNLSGLTASRIVLTDTSKNLVSLSAGTTGQVLTSQGSSAPIWTTPTGGTVTSVAMTVPSFMSITGSPITTSGTLALSATSTGAGSVVLATSPTLVTPTLGVASATSLLATSFIASQTTVNSANGGITSRNLSAGTSAYSFIELRNDGSSACTWFMNSSTKTSDGAVNSSTIRNDAGALRLQSSSAVGLEFTGTTATFTSSAVVLGVASATSVSASNFFEVTGTAAAFATRRITANGNYGLIYCANPGAVSSHLFVNGDASVGYMTIGATTTISSTTVNVTSLTASSAVFTDASKNLVSKIGGSNGFYITSAVTSYNNEIWTNVANVTTSWSSGLGLLVWVNQSTGWQNQNAESCLVTVTWSAARSSNGFGQDALRIVARGVVVAEQTATALDTISVSACTYLAQNETIQCQAWQNSASTLSFEKCRITINRNPY